MLTDYSDLGTSPLLTHRLTWLKKCRNAMLRHIDDNVIAVLFGVIGLKSLFSTKSPSGPE